MSIETWGDMNKSQIDSELVESAIARLIQAHNDDPDAHLGAGQSLTTHRASEIIDHLAGSVLADKFTRNELLWFSNFGESALWDTNNVHNYEWPKIALPEMPDTGDQAYMNFDASAVVGQVIHDTKDVMFQFTSYIDCSDTDSYGYVGFGILHTLDHVGFGFKFQKNACQVYVKSYITTSTANIINFVDGNNHVFRAEYHNVDNTVYFFADNVQVGSIVVPSGSFQYQPFFGFSTNVSSNESDFWLEIKSLMIGKSMV